ncbi:MAG: hemolysin, partial [Duncaniella sp.]|nr:hemolysin [Duncaniella sp.]
DEYRLDIPEDDEYQTLAGYIMHETGTLPAKGDSVVIDGITFTICERSATRLDLVRVECDKV